MTGRDSTSPDLTARQLGNGQSGGQSSLFAAPEPAVDPTAGLSAGRLLTRRQAEMLRRGLHPLSITSGHIPLHADAAPVDDRTAHGLRCGSCALREFHGHRGYQKCGHSGGKRVTHGAATDVRAWWPACRSYSPADGLS